MVNYKEETINTYNAQASNIAKKFVRIGARVDDIDKAFSFLKSKNSKPFVLELGCGNGRDAKAIIKQTPNYLGIDFSRNLIAIAKDYVHTAKFLVVDIETFIFPNNIDLILAFASLLHMDQKNLKSTFDKAHEKLNKEGVFYVSTKEGPYEKRREINQHGPRTFFYYNIELIKALTKDKYNVIYESKQFFRKNNWLTIALRKKF